jgi:hypothetical protein
MLASGQLLGFFWTSSKHAQFVMVSCMGLQCFELCPSGLVSAPASKDIQAEANLDLSKVLWYKYQYHSRLLLIGTQFELMVLQITGQVCGCP